MPLVKGSGTAVKKADFDALTDDVAVPVKGSLTEAIYEKYDIDNVAAHQTGLRLKFYEGQVITQDQFNAAFPATTFTSITPDTGPGSTPVTIVGTGFYGATGVKFATSPATSFVVVSDTEITCVTPAHADGAVDVTIVDDAGDLVVTDAFTYAA